VKLLYCIKCGDMKKLSMKELTTCECGLVRAGYIDELNAEWNGEGCMFGVNNASLVHAILAQRGEGDPPSGLGHKVDAFIIPMGAATVTINKNM
jgi:hypothetical protein